MEGSQSSSIEQLSVAGSCNTSFSSILSSAWQKNNVRLNNKRKHKGVVKAVYWLTGIIFNWQNHIGPCISSSNFVFNT